MSRRKAASKRVILPDPLFGSDMVAKFINVVMCNGKKSVAEKIVYGALEIIAEKNPLNKGSEAKAALSGSEDQSAKDKDKVKGIKGSIRTDANKRKIALEVFDKCLENLRPAVEVRSRRVGGANYQVPVEVRLDRSIALAMRWLVNFAKVRTEKTMMLRLANEILDVLSGRGGSVKKRETVYSMAKANQAFAHFRW
jgi:small subunit ribosomal protein S7